MTLTIRLFLAALSYFVNTEFEHWKDAKVLSKKYGWKTHITFDGRTIVNVLELIRGKKFRDICQALAKVQIENPKAKTTAL